MKDMTILVVDDEPDIAALVVSLLELEGYRTVRAASGREALDLAIDLKPNAVVLDLSLPDFDGVQVLRALRQQADTESIPVIVLSAYVARLSVMDRLLAQAVFEKPFDLDSLILALARLARPIVKVEVTAPPVHLRPTKAPAA